jgi:hypothetical protein
MEALRKFKTKNSEPLTENEVLMTATFKRVTHIANDALNNRLMVGLIGEAGYGKTTALRHFHQSNPERVFFVTVKPSMNPKNFWLEVLQAIPGHQMERSNLYNHTNLYYLLRKITGYLNRYATAQRIIKKDPATLLIFDEAGKFSQKMLEFMHEIRDEAPDTGILLAGPSYFYSNVRKWVMAGRVGMPEFASRVSYWTELAPPSRLEIKQYCEAFGITDQSLVDEIVCLKNYRSVSFRVREILKSKR